MSQVQTHFRLPGTRLLLATVFLGSWLVVGLAPAFAAPSLTVNGSSAPITVSSSATMTVGVQNGPGTANDCITLDLAGVVNNSAHLGFAWVTGSPVTLPFTMPGSAGAYAFRYWQGCATQLAISP